MHVNDAILKRLLGLTNETLSAPPELVLASIGAGESFSTAAATPHGKRAIALGLPPSWDDSDLSFAVSYDGQEFFEVADTANPVAPLVYQGGGRAGTLLYLPTYGLARAPFIKVRSGSLASPTTQSAARMIKIVCVPHNASDH